MKYDDLKKEAFEGNVSIVNNNLVTLTWGNVSCFDNGILAIKPSGVDYKILSWKDIVLVDLDGTIIDSKLKPSSDTLTHIELYKSFKNIKSIVHTHSKWGTIWAQSGLNIPCLGTTHADHFNGKIYCVNSLNKDEVLNDYEKNTGIKIVNFFNSNNINPLENPGCIVEFHAPFTWGKTMAKAVENAVCLEVCAEMAYFTLSLNKNSSLPKYILGKHYSRKHGKKAYYGQN